MMTVTMRLPEYRVAMNTAPLLLLAGIAWTGLAFTAAPHAPASSICGDHLAAAHEHCWRCYALAAAAIGFTLGVLSQLSRLAISQNQGR